MLKKTYRLRLLILGALSLLLFAAILIRLYYLQVVHYQTYAARARAQQNKRIQLTPRRGDILDRNGRLLATSYQRDTIVLDTRKFKTPDERLVGELADLLHRPTDSIRKYFSTPRRHMLIRKAPDETVAAVKELEERFGVPEGVFLYEKHSKREYPNGALACHILGYTKIDDNGDNIGQAGVERQYDEYLKGSYQKELIPVTSGQRGLAPIPEAVLEATYGQNVVLTIDENIQMFTEAALRRQVGKSQALGGIAVVMDVPTGEILAMASCPDFDLNEFAKATPHQLKNRLLVDPIQIGSVMKILTTTLLIDQGLLSADEMIDCQGGRGFVDGRKMTDSHHQGVVPFREAFAASSNIGLATVGLRLEPNAYYQGLVGFGVGQKAGIDLPGEGDGLLKTTDKWTRLSRTSLPIGYEVMLTAVEVISALQAIGNDGVRLRPRVVKEIHSPKGQVLKTFAPEMIERVASAATCKTVRELMEGVVTLKDGTGHEAAIPGFRIGGKTGTTVKTPPGVTPKTYYASFAGMMPIDKPRLAVYIYVDEPSVGGFYGGQVAAPIFKEIAVKAVHALGLEPSDPVAFEAAAQQIEAEALSKTAVAATSSTTETLLAALPPEADDELTSAAQESALVGSEGDPLMPNCVGLGLHEALQALEQAGVKAQLKGSGIVVRQEPAAGRPLAAGHEALLILARPSETMKSIGGLGAERAK